ncbi:hypothetical protein [Microbulbifer sp. YPW1]|uniref:hypothetical protein n=1 Tax=Microbulbifer sp. YPW1 TaxID=2745199 RepID=UPI001599DA56|nr:hypothetical protein [Microbulbifer sp. YPW1]QKX18084.1 hypothetical protein HUW35_14560 [Microbulbifer sp. YPW1]
MSNILIVTGHDFSISKKHGGDNALGASELSALKQFSRQFSGVITWKGAEAEPGSQLGWVDGVSYSRLDDLKAANVAHRFLLLFHAPETVFANAYKVSEGNLSIAISALDNWASANRAVLQFFQSNREISALVRTASALEQPAEFGRICCDLLGADIDISAVNSEDFAPELELLAPHLVERFDIYQELYDCLQLAATLPGADLEYSRDHFSRLRYLAEKAAVSLFKEQESESSTQVNDTLENSRALDGTVKELQEKNRHIEEEFELSILQLHQLQEELEEYYFRYEDLREKREEGTAIVSTQSPEIRQRSVDFARAAKISIVGAYAENGYQDIHLIISDISLADGRCLKGLRCKLVLKAGSPALEFRSNSEGAGEAEAISSWPEQMKDQYGQYILLLPSAEGEDQVLQQKMLASLSTVDRELLFSVANVIRDHFAMGFVQGAEGLPPEELRRWRGAAINLAQQAEEINSFLTLDAVDLKEEMDSDSYNHLWFVLHNLQFGKKKFSRYGFKLAAVPEDSSGKLIFEFRELSDSTAPFEAWPPSESDEYGHKLLVEVQLSAKRATVNLSDEITHSDLVMLSEVIRFSPSFIETLADSGLNSSRGWEFWRDKVVGLKGKPIIFNTHERGLVRRAISRMRR